jgi:hypothetical protein
MVYIIIIDYILNKLCYPRMVNNIKGGRLADAPLHNKWYATILFNGVTLTISGAPSEQSAFVSARKLP